MDSSSRSASPREPARPQHRPPSPPSPTAFDNRAYQHDEADQNHNDSFTSNGPQQNGHSKEPNGDTKTLEAVNLELINLTPKNGNAKKKDAVELDMSTTNPYDEYFVPVNEHRKYMRGEKLYVTADKRGEKGGCKRPLCWTLLALVAAVIVALIVLAATGILFSNSPTTVEQYNSSVSSARAFGGVLQDHSQHDHDHNDHDHEHDEHDHHDHSHDHNTQSTNPEQETQSDEGRSFTADDINDPSMYVPMTVEGELKIDNEGFTPALQDTDSQEYREFTATFSDALKRALFDRNTIERGDNEIMVEVVKLREGSVIVQYRIHWRPKPGMEATENLLTPETLKSNIDNYLDRNNRMISTYHVAEDKISTSLVLDICKISKYDCEYECVFDERTLDFTCTCPPGHILDMMNLKKCVPILGNSNEQVDKDATNETGVRNIELKPSTSKPDEEKTNTESVEVQTGNVFDWKETHHVNPVTTTQPDTDVSFSHIFGNANETPAPEPAAEPKAEPVPTAEPKPEPESTVEPTAEPAAEPAGQPEPAAEPEPTSEPQAAAEPSSRESNLSVEPLSGLEPAAEPEPTTEPTPEPEPIAEPAHKLQPAAEPNAEPEPQPVTEDASEVEHAAEPAPKPTSEPAAETTSEPAAEPTSEPAAEPTTKPEAEPAAEPAAEPTAKPEAEPAAEPAAEPTAKPESEPAAEPAAEPEPTSKPESSDNTKSEPSLSAQDHFLESITESTPEQKTKSETVNSQSSAEQEIIPVIPAQNFETETETEGTAEVPNTTETQTNDLFAETTTARISISEPNLINEPSYEPKPEIISILSKTKPMNENFEESETTTNSEWLENHKPINVGMKQASVSNGNNFFEPRSFSSYDNEFVAETTTENDVNEDNMEGEISFQDINDNIKVTNTTAQPDIIENKDQSTTVVSIVHSDQVQMDNAINSPSKILVTADKDKNHQVKNTTEAEKATEEDATERNVQIKNNNENYDKKSVIYRTKTNKINEDLSMETTTTQKATVTENSIQSYFEPDRTNITEMLLDALSNRKNAKIPVETTTIKYDVNDSTDITFDNINNINQYNRSSKAFESEDTATEPSELPDSTKDSVTTESEWLSVPVKEVNYTAFSNNVQKEGTTPIPMTKLDEIINQDVPKDDFEPDYLNGLGSTSGKMTEADVPMYGITHDYDNEDSRVKRVDNETTIGLTKEILFESTTKKMADESSSIVNISSETTTISQYIYETVGKLTNMTHEITKTTTKESNDNINPAPVWEESEAEKDMLEETPKIEENTQNELTTSTSTSTTTEAPTTISPEDIVGMTNNNTTNESISAQNSTRVNNFGVTVYEVSSHSNLSATTSNTTNSHSAEYEEHEVDMNPFLPEVENNKHLVKKLQEGHDLEPNNLNETQNENVEEHPVNTSEQQITSTNSSSNTQSEVIVSTPSVVNENASVSNTKEEKDHTKIIQEKDSSAAFLEDTGDLQPEWESEEYKASKTSMTGPSERDSEYLSVVPIEQEQKALRKAYESRNLQGLNDISDSPKKSDKRTLDVTKLESVTNNEA